LRIARQQEERSARARRGAARAEEALASGALGAERAGEVVARYGAQADVRTTDGAEHRCYLRANLESVVAGDRVTFRIGDGSTGSGVIVARDPRGTELRRPDKSGRLRTVAANIDQVVIVIAPLPEAHANLIDRYLVATENLGAEATLLLNKSDLLRDPALRARMDTLLEPYAPLGYRVLESCAREGALPRLREILAGRRSILVGQSGVGKTTLANALLPQLNERTNSLSPDKAKGRHTTTTARLYPMNPGSGIDDAGGALIDSPGIREFGLWHMDRAEVERGFREFRDRIGACRFRDCKHEGEPGCAVLEALAEGKLHPARLESYRRIVASLTMDD
jgi:ribosome biogenesis GTPase